MINNTEDQTKSKENNSDHNDIMNVDFGKILLFFWKDKWITICIIILSLIFAIYYIRTSPFKYEVSLELIKISDTGSVGTNNNYSGFARILGLNLSGSQDDSNFDVYKKLIKSRLISQSFSENDQLMNLIIGNAWDPVNKKLLPTDKSGFDKFKNSIKRMIGLPVFEGSRNVDNIIYDMLQSITIVPGGSRNIIKLTYLTSEPLIGKSLLENAHSFADNFLKSRSKDRTQKYIDFLLTKLDENKNQNIRMSLIQTLSSQHKALMISSSDLAFTAEKFGKTEVSTYPVSPKPRLIISFALVLSLLLSILISIFKNKILNKF